MKIIVTGGAGFIGSAVVRQLIAATDAVVVNLDKLTYAGNLETLAEAADDPRHVFAQIDICDGPRVDALFQAHAPDAVLHLAAESHVDRSIDGPGAFVDTNLVGTYTMLEAARRYWERLDAAARRRFRFAHVSTDEVFGSLGPTGAFTETSRYKPNSPYAASKAGADHLARAWRATYGLPVIVTNCSNNYGPYQFPEKLIPLMILKALAGEPMPVYGTGENVRDWLYVEDHAAALRLVLDKAEPGQTYNIGGRAEHTNIQIVHAICDLMDELSPDSPHRPHRDLIAFVADRPGHDRRYAIDCAKIERELGWTPAQDFEGGLHRTVEWYLANRTWWERVRSGAYRGERLGAGDTKRAAG